MDSSGTFIDKLIRCHLANVDTSQPEAIFQQLMNTNPNARCLIATEIENTGSRKHLMGSAVNAAALGRIGLAIAWNPGMLKAFVNLKRYFDYLASVGKNTFNTANLLILDHTQLKQAIEDVVGVAILEGQ